MTAYYLCGPMSGIPKFNYPAFIQAAEQIRLVYKFELISPVELDSPEIRDACLESKDGVTIPAAAGTWGQLLSRDVQVVADKVDGLIFLPGWERSRGARLEAFVGLLTGKIFAAYEAGLPFNVRPLNTMAVRSALKENMP